MARGMSVEVVDRLTPSQEEDLARLFQDAWWAGERQPEEVRRMLRGSDVIVGLVEAKGGELIAFARAVTDGVFKAFVFDTIVALPYRGRGHGRRLMEALLQHPAVRSVRDVELYCLPDMMPFYRRWGFEEDPEGVHLMRRRAVPRNPQKEGSP